MYEIVDLSKLNHKHVEGLGQMTYWHDGFRHGKFRETIFIFMHWRQNLRLLKGKNTPQQKYGINIETIYLTKYPTSQHKHTTPTFEFVLLSYAYSLVVSYVSLGIF